MPGRTRGERGQILVPNTLFVLLALLVASGHSLPADTTRLARTTNHWLANTGGRPDNHVQNFVTDMVTYYPYAFEGTGRGGGYMLLTASWWDEGHCGYCSYQDGEQLGKSENHQAIIHSDTAVFGSTKCQINHFYGRFFFTTQAPVPTSGPNAPTVTCSTGDTLRYPSILDPSAIGFDNHGRLLVGENGPDQNIQIYAFGPLRKVGTFGDSGGVFARSKPGASSVYRPGEVGPRRFWGIRGISVDSANNLYVACSGLPMQTIGGTHIRAFSGLDSTLQWEVHGLSFVNNADADPDSSGSSVFLDGKRFHMDYSKPPGKSWDFRAVTLDPFRFPGDPRLGSSMESIWVRRVGGRMFQYHTDMVGGFVAVVRFDDSSEIGIPTAFFCTYEDRQNGWGSDSAPAWTRSEPNKRLRWYWVDKNGDGIAQKSEFHTYENWSMYNQAIDVDENGNIWLGGDGTIDRKDHDGGITMFPLSPDDRGIPRFTIDSIKRYATPFDENYSRVRRIKVLAHPRIAFVTTGPTNYHSSVVMVYPGFPDSVTQTCRLDLGFNDLDSVHINLDQGTAGMTLPWSMTADSQYIYVTYADNGRWSRRRGEVSVYDHRTCSPVGWMGPSAETGWASGAIDLVNALNVTTRKDGSRVVFLEDDGSGKVMAHLWVPKSDTGGQAPQPLQPAGWRVGSRDGELAFYGPIGGGTADAYDLQGKWLHRWNLPPTGGSRSWMTLKSDFRSSRSRFLVVRADGDKQVFSIAGWTK